MAKRKTPKSQAPASEAVSPEAPILSLEVAVGAPRLEPAISEISADTPAAETPVAMELGEVPPASPLEEAVAITEVSAPIDGSAGQAPAINVDAKDPRAAPWGTRGVYLRAASIALAVAFGAAVGSLAPVVLERLTSAANADVVAPDPTIALAASVEKLAAAFATLKAEGAEADRSVEARVAALAERFDAAAKQQGELVARIAEIATAVAARPTTTAAAVSGETTGSVEPRKPAIADGWTLWRVHNGRALVEGHGRLYDIVPGADLPGLGPVQRIQRSEGRWIVVTQNGIIVPRRG